MAATTAADVVLFETVATNNGCQLGIVTLNVPATLNSLSLAMIDLLTPQLQQWRDDDNIVMVLFQSNSDKAFSAGGDIQALYQSMVAQTVADEPVAYAEAFFEREYRLDYLIHTYPKPTLVWAQGIVMGGGLGIMGGCSHRIGTATTRLALPEITIGLFPDAGATWFLSKMPRHWAYFIAWTGCQLNAVDGKYLGLIDYLLAFEEKPAVLQQLLDADWHGDGVRDKALLGSLLAGLEGDAQEFPAGQLAPRETAIQTLMTQVLASDQPVPAFARAVASFADDDVFLTRAAKSINSGSPTTAHIIHEQLQRARGLSLKQCFQLELVIAVQCSRHPDFAEGVRALLIDKDNKPAWRYPNLDQVPDDWVQAHFNLPWAINPLVDMLETA
jgi:enoyl-CoA hydratase/carnithine racemase